MIKNKEGKYKLSGYELPNVILSFEGARTLKRYYQNQFPLKKISIKKIKI
jgi:hypothetical protein